MIYLTKRCTRNGHGLSQLIGCVGLGLIFCTTKWRQKREINKSDCFLATDSDVWECHIFSS